GHDGVEGAALPHRDDGGAAGHRFDGDDAEILDTWHEQGVAAAVHVDQDVVGGGAEEGGLGTGEGFQVAAVAAVADDDQTTAGAAGDADGQVGALVGDQTAGEQQEVLARERRVGGETVQAHGRVDDLGGQPPPVADAVGDGAGVGDDSGQVPGGGQFGAAGEHPERGERGTARGAARFAGTEGRFPRPAGWTVHVGDDGGVGGQRGLDREGMVADDDRVVAAQRQSAQGARHERHERGVGAAAGGGVQAVEPGAGDGVPRRVGDGGGAGGVDQRREHLRVRPGARELTDDRFGAAVFGETF